MNLLLLATLCPLGEVVCQYIFFSCCRRSVSFEERFTTGDVLRCLVRDKLLAQMTGCYEGVTSLLEFFSDLKSLMIVMFVHEEVFL